MADDKRGALVRATERPDPWSYNHPLNPKSEVHGQSLGAAGGMERLGVHLIRVPAGKENFVHHAHHVEEECYFIVSGRGILELGDEEHEVGPGDFVGFGTPSIGHHLRNPFDEDLVYLVAGERARVEVADFPKLGKKIVRVGREAQVVDDAELKPFWKAD